VAAALMTNSAWAQEKPEATNLDEVVVTAQKVSQSVIDVPLSISVLAPTIWSARSPRTSRTT
jgi:outer membrane cobalamin receptor